MIQKAGKITRIPLSFLLCCYSRKPEIYLPDESLNLPEDFHASLQNPLHLRNDHTVIRKGNARVPRALHAVSDFPLIEHTAAAVDHQAVTG